MWHDRKGIPNELKAMTDRDEKLMLSVHHQDKEMMLVSYQQKQIWQKEYHRPDNNAQQSKGDE